MNVLKKIKRKDCFEQYPLFPRANPYRNKFYYPLTVDRYVLTVPSRSVRGHAKALAQELTKLTTALGCDSLIFIGDRSGAWLRQHNDYKPVKKALEYLIDHKIGEKFNGGLEVANSELPDFLVHLFWLQRCNAALPDYHFMNADQQFVGYICKYGNLHLDIIDVAIVTDVTSVISKTKFEYTDLSYCGGGAIAGRQTIV